MLLQTNWKLMYQIYWGGVTWFTYLIHWGGVTWFTDVVLPDSLMWCYLIHWGGVTWFTEVVLPAITEVVLPDSLMWCYLIHWGGVTCNHWGGVTCNHWWCSLFWVYDNHALSLFLFSFNLVSRRSASMSAQPPPVCTLCCCATRIQFTRPCTGHVRTPCYASLA